MIIFKEVSHDTNIVHVIYGPETDFQLNMSGHVVIPLDDKFEPNKKNFLFFNRCECTEEELRDQFDYFSHQISQEISQDILKHNFQKKENKSKKESLPVSPQSSPTHSHTSSQNESFMTTLKCPKCLSWGTFIKDGTVTMCKTCQDIEKGIETVTPMTKREKRFLDNLLKNDDKKD